MIAEKNINHVESKEGRTRQTVPFPVVFSAEVFSSLDPQAAISPPEVQPLPGRLRRLWQRLGGGKRQ
ncbi:MAG TPA: hypothetical protein ENN40_08995 [Candidatus Aminicenantes bacterium]|nr:hypothetical protein [Candidatus Aminicenantes bacterium]